MRVGSFVKRKEVWVPTWRGWLTLLVCLAVFAIGSMLWVAPFLAPTKPLGAPVLVVEGWMSEWGLKSAIDLDNSNHYAAIFTTGLEIERGMDISQYGTYAQLGAVRLVNLGLKNTNVIAIPAPHSRRDRTYHSALALRGYLLTNTPYRKIDLISESVHSRRSWMMFRAACGKDIEVGVIATPAPDFKATSWWRTSNGVRTVLNEAIGYLYAKIFFHGESE